MPSEVVKTVKPSGGDYTSLSAWEAGEQRDLVTADEIAVAECYAMSDTTALGINGWTTDSTRYIKIYTPSSERHDGKWNSSKYRLEVTLGGSGSIITNYEEYVTIDGLQFSITNSTASSTYCISNYADNASSALVILNSIIKAASLVAGSYAATGINCGIGSRTSYNYIVNCVIYDFDNGGTVGYGMYFEAGSSDTVYGFVYNTTLYGNHYGIVSFGSYTDVTVKNTISYGNYGNYYGSYNSNSTNNLSGPSQSDAPGSNPVNDATVTFVDEGNDDFHLSSSDTSAKDAGVDLSSDTYFPFSDDIDGETRTGTWDIGADEYVSGGMTKTVSDSGQGADSIGGIGVTLKVNDAGAGADAFGGVAASVPISDSGQGTDALGGVAASVPVADSGQGSDVVAQIKAALAVLDSSQGTDTIVINAGVLVSDSGSGADAVSILQAVLKTVSDFAQGNDAVPSISVSVPVSDSGQGLDIVGAVHAVLSVADSAHGLDVVIRFSGDDPKRVTITFTAKGPSVSFKGKGPGISFSGRGPSITFN